MKSTAGKLALTGVSVRQKSIETKQYIKEHLKPYIEKGSISFKKGELSSTAISTNRTSIANSGYDTWSKI